MRLACRRVPILPAARRKSKNVRQKRPAGGSVSRFLLFGGRFVNRPYGGGRSARVGRDALIAPQITHAGGEWRAISRSARRAGGASPSPTAAGGRFVNRPYGGGRLARVGRDALIAPQIPHAGAERRAIPRSAEHRSANPAQNDAGQCPALRARGGTGGRGKPLPYGGGRSARVGRDALIAPQIPHAGGERRATTRGRPYGAGRRAAPALSGRPARRFPRPR